jgi:hypothetical protein
MLQTQALRQRSVSRSLDIIFSRVFSRPIAEERGLGKCLQSACAHDSSDQPGRPFCHVPTHHPAPKQRANARLAKHLPTDAQAFPFTLIDRSIRTLQGNIWLDRSALVRKFCASGRRGLP